MADNLSTGVHLGRQKPANDPSEVDRFISYLSLITTRRWIEKKYNNVIRRSGRE
jgi:hypothetical protein